MYLQASIQYFAVCVASVLCRQNVRMPELELVDWCACFTVGFVFIDHKLCIGKGVRQFQALFCAYATVINEAPGEVSSDQAMVKIKMWMTVCSVNFRIFTVTA